MKKLLIAAVITGLPTLCMAESLTKCIKRPQRSWLCTRMSGGQGNMDWMISCQSDDGEDGQLIKGVAACGTGTDSNGNLVTSSRSADNKNCYCKMYWPAESKWVYSVGSKVACIYDCGNLCSQIYQMGDLLFSDLK